MSNHTSSRAFVKHMQARTIPLILSGRGVRRGQVISPGPGHTAVPPTVMTHLDLSVDAAWGWESEAFGF